jgi:hypothetical protein
VKNPKEGPPRSVGIVFLWMLVATLVVTGYDYLRNQVFVSTPEYAGDWNFLQRFGFYGVLFGFLMFVMISRERGWLGPLRRWVHGILLATIAGVSVWVDPYYRDQVAWWAAGAFVLGLFVERWVAR